MKTLLVFVLVLFFTKGTNSEITSKHNQLYFYTQNAVHNLEFDLQQLEEEGVDVKLDAALFTVVPSWLSKAIEITGTDSSSFLELNPNEIRNLRVNGRVDVILTRCMKMFEEFSDRKVAGSIGQGFLGLIPLYSEIKDGIDTAHEISQISSSPSSTKGDVAIVVAESTTTKVLDFLYKYGTLTLGPLIAKGIGALSKWITGLVQGETGRKYRACSICYLSSIAARIHQAGGSSSEPADSYRLPVASACDFQAARSGYINSKYFYDRLDDYFSTSDSINKFFDAGVTPAAKIAAQIRDVASGNDFQKAVKTVGPAGVTFLMSQFWEALVVGNAPHNKIPIYDHWLRN